MKAPLFVRRDIKGSFAERRSQRQCLALVQSLHVGRPPHPPGVKCDAEPVDGRDGGPAAAVSQLQNLGNGRFFTANPEEPTSGALAVNSLRLRPAKVHFWKFYRKESERWLAGKTWPFDATPMRRLEVRKTVAAGRRGRGRGRG